MADERMNESAARRNLQTYLRQLANFDSSIPFVPIDGNRGDDTTEAIRAFQIRQGLSPTGIADPETWDAIYEEYLLSLEQQALPSPFSPFPSTPADYSLGAGDSGFPVAAIQYLLEALSVLFPIDAVRVTGIYDEPTERAVSEIQQRHLLPVTGRTDKLTWNALVRLYESTALYT